MSYLSRLVAQPGVDIPALVLAAGSNGLAGDLSQQPVIDETARTAYAERARELTQAVADADADLALAERARLELDPLVDELERASGLNSRTPHVRRRRRTGPGCRAQSGHAHLRRDRRQP